MLVKKLNIIFINVKKYIISANHEIIANASTSENLKTSRFFKVLLVKNHNVRVTVLGGNKLNTCADTINFLSDAFNVKASVVGDGLRLPALIYCVQTVIVKISSKTNCVN